MENKIHEKCKRKIDRVLFCFILEEISVDFTVDLYGVTLMTKE